MFREAKLDKILACIVQLGYFSETIKVFPIWLQFCHWQVAIPQLPLIIS